MIRSKVNLKPNYKNIVIFLSLYFAEESAVFLHYFQFYHRFYGCADLLDQTQYVINLLCFIFFTTINYKE